MELLAEDRIRSRKEGVVFSTGLPDSVVSEMKHTGLAGERREPRQFGPKTVLEYLQVLRMQLVSTGTAGIPELTDSC